MRNNWPETIDELLDECRELEGRDLYTLGERGEPFFGEDEPRVDGTDYLAGEYQYGVMMIPVQWVTHVISDSTLGRGECHNDGDQKDFLCSECGARMFIDTGETYTMIDSLENIIEQPSFCPNCGCKIKED